MSGRYEAQAAHAPIPGAGTQFTVTDGVSTGPHDLSAFANSWVVLIANVKTHLRGGTLSVGDAAATDFWLPADLPMQFKVTPSRTHIKLRGNGGSGVLSVAQVDE